MACGISEDVFANWRRADLVFAEQVERVAGQTALRLLQKIEAQGKENFSACAWLLERRFPQDFSRPEVQLNLIQQNNTVENSLTINITAAEYAAIEAQHDPIREKVQAMIRAYRPQPSGNGEKVREVEAKPVTQQPTLQPAEEAIITHRAGDESRAGFWVQFTGDRDRAVEVSTAIFVVNTIVGEVIGAHRVGKVEFKGPINVGDCLDQIDKLVGVGNGAGWQRLQHKAGF